MNRAFEEGKRRYPWWPDWQGECAAIIASGESTKKVPITRTENRIHVIAIYRNIELVPWAEVVYGCDEAWWKGEEGLKKYKGIKMSYGVMPQYKDIHRVKVVEREDFLLNEPMEIGSGGNSGFQAINLAVQFGVTDIVLVGYDCKGQHWFGRNRAPLNNPAESNFQRWLKAFEFGAKTLQKNGVSVVNTSMDSRISCFPKMPLEDVMREWGL